MVPKNWCRVTCKPLLPPVPSENPHQHVCSSCHQQGSEVEKLLPSPDSKGGGRLYHAGTPCHRRTNSIAKISFSPLIHLKTDVVCWSVFIKVGMVNRIRCHYTVPLCHDIQLGYAANAIVALYSDAIARLVIS